MTMPGAPCIYYGTEIGMTGATDPYCRAAFPWHKRESWNEELLDFFKRATALRHAHPILRMGKVRTLYADHGVYACMREVENERENGVASAGAASGAVNHPAAVIVYNTHATPLKVNLNKIGAEYEGATFRGVWHGEGNHVVKDGALHEIQVPGRDAVVLMQEERR
jgi:neopullulanase